MITVEVALDGHEYRCVGGEIHRRPIEREKLPVWQAAWCVTHKEDIPSLTRELLLAQFEMGQIQTATN